MKLAVFHAEAKAELQEAAAWYDERHAEHSRNGRRARQPQAGLLEEPRIGIEHT